MSEQDIKSAANAGRVLLVLDDLIVGISETQLNTVFTRGSHNWGVSVVLITQHLFAKEVKMARNNLHYLVLMRSPAGEAQVSNLATQLFKQRRDLLLQSYNDATSDHFSYLLLDMHPSSNKQLLFKTHIYHDEWPIRVFTY